MIHTATSKIAGVIHVDVHPGHKSDFIINNVLKQLFDPPFKFMDPIYNAKQVIWWFRLFTRGRSPIIVMNVIERKDGDEYANAVRSLVDNYKLNVVVDGSPNSLDESLFKTRRQQSIKPMSKEMIWQIPQLQNLFYYIKKADLENTTFAVLGEIPLGYEQFGIMINIK